MKLKTVLRWLHLWPPYWGAGIRVVYFSPDIRKIDVEMKLRFWNKNYVGTHFGGSMYSMADPFIMLMLLHNLGPQYIVWDKAATIRFKKPGRGRIIASFLITEADLKKIKDEAECSPKVEPVFNIVTRDEQGDVVAEVEKILYVKRKQNQ